MIRRKLFWLPSALVVHRKNTPSYTISYLPSSPVCSELGEVHGWRGCSSGAAVDSDNLAPLSADKRKRVSKKERRAMVIAFVNKYREMNAGKFPTVSAACKQVGGSYYVARIIIQELEHNSKFTPINEMFENSSVQSRTDENKLFSELLEDSGSQVPINTSSAESMVSNSSFPAEYFTHANIPHKETDKDLAESQLTVNTAVRQIMTDSDKVLADDVSGNVMSEVDEVQKDSAVTDVAVGNNISNDGKLKLDGEYEELQADKMRTDDAVTHDFISGSEFVAMDVSSSQNVEDMKLDRDSNELASDHLRSADNDKYSQEKDVLRESTLNEDDSKFRAQLNPCKMRSETPCISEKGEIDKNEETGKKYISGAKSTIDSESLDSHGITSDRPVQKTDNDEPKKSSVWGNLKSIANNIIGIWKRLK